MQWVQKFAYLPTRAQTLVEYRHSFSGTRWVWWRTVWTDGLRSVDCERDPREYFFP